MKQKRLLCLRKTPSDDEAFSITEALKEGELENCEGLIMSLGTRYRDNVIEYLLDSAGIEELKKNSNRIEKPRSKALVFNSS